MQIYDAEQLALNLMRQHNLSGWSFKFNKSIKTFGVCDYNSKTIVLSEEIVLLAAHSQVQNTILHEIAHALTPEHYHNNVWRQKAIEIGCDGKRCYDLHNDILNTDDKRKRYEELRKIKYENYRYRFVCIDCDRIEYRRIKPKYSGSCFVCGEGKYNPKYKMILIDTKHENK